MQLKCGVFMSIDKKWFIPNDETLVPYGPFTSDEVRTKLQDGSLKLDNFIWAEGSGKEWVHIFEVDEFKNIFKTKPACKLPPEVSVIEEPRSVESEQTQNLKSENLNNSDKLNISENLNIQLDQSLANDNPPVIEIKKQGEYGIENVYRRFPRVPFESTVILHNQIRGDFFTSFDISEKGISVKVDHKVPFGPSEEVIVTVRDFPELGTFTTRAVVLRQFVVKDQTILGFYFLHLNPKIRRYIAQYVFNELKRIHQDQQAM